MQTKLRWKFINITLIVFTYQVIAPVNASTDLHSSRTDIANAKIAFYTQQNAERKKRHTFYAEFILKIGYKWIYYNGDEM